MNSERKKILLDLLFPALFVALLWIIQFGQTYLHLSLNEFGIFPRSLRGIPGIFLAPLIHGSNSHLLSNSLPLLILGTMMFYFYQGIAFRIFFWIYLMTGLWVWAGARGGGAYHLGASGLIYGFVSFLFFAGIFRKDSRLLRISLFVLIFYNGLVWGVFPLVDSISWESHLLGSLAGILCAWYFRKEGPERHRYSWETEPEEDDSDEDDPEGGEEAYQPQEPPLRIQYVFKPLPKK